jgi:hypothetical protein
LTESLPLSRVRRPVYAGVHILLSLLLFASHPVRAQKGFLENGTQLNRGSDSGFMLDTPTRKKIDLSGDWTFSLQDGESGSVKVPSAYIFPAKVTFQRKFDISAEDLDMYRFHMVFYGVNYLADVSVNGEFVMSHPGGCTSFVEEIPPNLLQVGPENSIRVVTNNLLDMKKSFPLKPRVWGMTAYGGIVRDAFLLATPLLYVKDAVVRSELDKDATKAVITVTAAVDGPDPQADSVAGVKPGKLGLVVEVMEKLSGLSVVRSATIPVRRSGDAWEEVSATLTIPEPKIWRPETPELYLVKVSLVTEADKQVSLVDEYDVTHGIRSLVVEKGDIRLNGKRLFLKGVAWYEDHPIWGCALTTEQMERDVISIKNLGANLIRFSGHPPHPYMLNLCDRYGLLAMEELPVSAPAGLLGNEAYREIAVTLMREMVMRDRNHVSVLAWGIGDEFDATEEGSRKFVEELVRQAKVLDPRPTYYGALLSRTDRCSDLVDLAAVNLYARDSREFKSELEIWRGRNKGRPLIVSRFGTEVQNDNRGGYSDPLSQQAQARFFIQRFDVLRSLDYGGGIVWSYNDWRGDRPALMVHTRDPRLYSMGLVSAGREKRIAYDAVRSVFQGEKFSALPEGSYSPSAPIIYVLSGFVLLVGLAYLYNTNRRFRESLNRSLLSSYNFFADIRDQRAVAVLHSTLLGLIVSFAIAVVLSSFLLHFRDSRFLDDLLSFLLVEDGVKIALVQLVWSPLRFILFGGMMIFLSLLILGGVVMALRMILKTRVYAYHAYTIVMWATSPLIILIPVGMILYRVMESPVYVLPALVLFAVLMIWTVLRGLKGLSIVFDASRARVYTIAVGMALFVGAGLYVYYDVAHAAPTYLPFIFQTLSSGG